MTIKNIFTVVITACFVLSLSVIEFKTMSVQANYFDLTEELQIKVLKSPPIVRAAVNGDASLLTSLIGYGADVENTPLAIELATWFNYKTIVAILVANGAPISDTTIGLAVGNRNRIVTELLLLCNKEKSRYYGIRDLTDKKWGTKLKRLARTSECGRFIKRNEKHFLHGLKPIFWENYLEDL